MKIFKSRKTRKEYYVHAILWEWGGRAKYGPYRWEWLAWWKATSIIVDYPHGMATVTDNPKLPEIIYE